MPEWATVCLRGLGANPVRARAGRAETYERFALILLAESLDIRLTVRIEEVFAAFAPCLL